MGVRGTAGAAVARRRGELAVHRPRVPLTSPPRRWPLLFPPSLPRVQPGQERPACQRHHHAQAQRAGGCRHQRAGASQLGQPRASERPTVGQHCSGSSHAFVTPRSSANPQPYHHNRSRPSSAPSETSCARRCGACAEVVCGAVGLSPGRAGRSAAGHPSGSCPDYCGSACAHPAWPPAASRRAAARSSARRRRPRCCARRAWSSARRTRRRRRPCARRTSECRWAALADWLAGWVALGGSHQRLGSCCGSARGCRAGPQALRLPGTLLLSCRRVARDQNVARWRGLGGGANAEGVAWGPGRQVRPAAACTPLRAACARGAAVLQQQQRCGSSDGCLPARCPPLASLHSPVRLLPACNLEPPAGAAPGQPMAAPRHVRPEPGPLCRLAHRARACTGAAACAGGARCGSAAQAAVCGARCCCWMPRCTRCMHRPTLPALPAPRCCSQRPRR